MEVLDTIPRDIVYYLYRDSQEYAAMGRTKGSTNKATNEKIITSSLSPEERIKLLANLIIDKILEDQRQHKLLLIKLRCGYGK